jgi:hypothetical protein
MRLACVIAASTPRRARYGDSDDDDDDDEDEDGGRGRMRIG